MHAAVSCITAHTLAIVSMSNTVWKSSYLIEYKLFKACKVMSLKKRHIINTPIVFSLLDLTYRSLFFYFSWLTAITVKNDRAIIWITDLQTGLKKAFLSFFHVLLFGGCVAHEIIPKLSEEYMAGKMNLDKLISHTMRLEKINEAFDLMHAGKRFVSSRCILLLK